ncbi:MAG: universal stress protein, partial [Acidimicrobiia bacterium]
EGAKRGAVVQAVHVWEVPVIYGPVGIGFPYDTTPIEDASRKLLDEVVDKALSETGEHGVTVERTLLSGGVATTVLDASSRADLLVVGRRGMGGFQRLLLGSVSEHLARHAPCPVVVIPAEEP